MNLFNFFTPKGDTFFLPDTATVRQAMEKFDYHKFSVVPLIDKDGAFLTTVSEGDVLRFMKNRAGFDLAVAEDTRVLDIERYRPYRACKYGATFGEVLALALEQNFVPLTDDRGSFMGIIKRKSILGVLYDNIDLNEVFQVKEKD